MRTYVCISREHLSQAVPVGVLRRQVLLQAGQGGLEEQGRVQGKGHHLEIKVRVCNIFIESVCYLLEFYEQLSYMFFGLQYFIVLFDKTLKCCPMFFSFSIRYMSDYSFLSRYSNRSNGYFLCFIALCLPLYLASRFPSPFCYGQTLSATNEQIDKG